MIDSGLITILARQGRAQLTRGQSIKITNTDGSQVIDTWCFNADDLTEFISMGLLRAALGRLWPLKGDLYTRTGGGRF